MNYTDELIEDYKEKITDQQGLANIQQLQSTKWSDLYTLKVLKVLSDIQDL